MADAIFGGNFFGTIIKLHDNIKDMSPEFAIPPTALLALLSELAYLPSKKELADRLGELPSRLNAAARVQEISLEDSIGVLADIIRGRVEIFQSALLISAVLENDKCIVIAHHGTATGHDILRDADVRFRRITFDRKRVRLHEGFCRALEENYPKIKSYVSRLLRNKQRPIYVTGHSLGGAVALINGLKFKTGCFPAQTWGAYSFGAPKTAGWNARQLLHDGPSDEESKLRYYRIVRLNDPIPNLPPIVTGFFQCGIEKYIEPKLKIRDTVPFQQRSFLFQTIDTFSLMHPSQSIFEAHGIEEYRKDMFQIAGRPSIFNWDN